MKSPADLAARLQKQWQVPDHREKRLLDPSAWPISLPIGKPTPTEFTTQGPLVREHVRLWRAVKIGQVRWEGISYRAGAEPVQVPTNWFLRTPAEWAAATADPAIVHEQQKLASVLAHVDPIFYRALTRGLRNFAHVKLDEVLQAARL